MKAVLYNKKSPQRLVYSEAEKPIPNENEILIEVHATSVNAADYRMVALGFPPKKKIFGADIAGIVESVGSNVTNFKPGDKVFGDVSDFGFGGFAEYAAVPENSVIHKPELISFEDAAALPLAGVTALQAVKHGGEPKQGDHILIVGASGGVGSFATQIAKAYGAVVTGVCSTKNIEQTKQLGAEFIIDYTKEDFTETNKKFDRILSINGSNSLSKCKNLLNPNGRYLMVGGTFGHVFKTVIFGKLISTGSKKITNLAAKSNIEDLKTLTALMLEGKIKPVIDKTFSLSETPDAFKYIKEKHAHGKVLIKIK